MLPLSACLVYLEEGTEIRGRTSHFTLNLSSHSCLETHWPCALLSVFNVLALAYKATIKELRYIDMGFLPCALFICFDRRI